MSVFRVIAGDFQRERVEFDGIGLNLQNLTGAREYIDVAKIADIGVIEREWRSGFGDKLSGLAAGGIVGGIAAGAMAGGLTGPAGAILGAVAGAVLAGRRFITCQVMLADGRRFIATANTEAWSAIRSGRHVTEQASEVLQSKEPTKLNPVVTGIKNRIKPLLRRQLKADDGEHA